MRDLGAEDDAGKILYSNHYHWFRRISHGIYEISSRGSKDLLEYPDIVKNCKLQLQTLTESLKYDQVAEPVICDEGAAK